MTTVTTHNWYEANQRSLMDALAEVRRALQEYIPAGGQQESGPEKVAQAEPMLRILSAAEIADTETVNREPALQTLCATFGLSPFERGVLLLCAGMELDASFSQLCAAAQGNIQRGYTTFSLALAVLADAHWSALAPGGPLRYWRLLEVGSGSSLTSSPLRIDERILHYLTGISHVDERLVGLIEPLHQRSELAPSQQAIVEQVVRAWSRTGVTVTLPVVQLCGDDLASKREIAAAACEAVGLHVYRMSAYTLPTSAAEFEAFARLWEREAVLSGSALLLECDEVEGTDPAYERSITRMVEAARGVLMVSSRHRRRAVQRAIRTFEVYKPTVDEQRAMWQQVLGNAAQGLNGQVERLVAQFRLSPAAIAAASTEVLGRVTSTEGQDVVGEEELSEIVWESCRIQARPRLDDLAQRIEPYADWDELVLPELQKHMLHDIAAHVRQRAKVYETWGFATKGERGLGINALFAGSSGTGKTMAAEVLAHELHLDLYRIDLSSVVSKYIGETEKNLRRVFDAAEEGGAILLFDEADALFGKRSEVKDSHDRYANIEISYLLQRMEAYRGLAILTTNMKSALDTAFMRRLRFVVQFPFPDATQRAEIWRRIFPKQTPTEKLDMVKLGRLNVAGGNIRNIALNAAFLAADAGEPVRMGHILRAARSEYAKLEKSLTEAEIGGWL